MSSLINKPTFLENKNYRFLIMDCPSDSNISSYAEVLKKKHAVAVTRACEASYSTQLLKDAGIRVLDVPFPDGDPPSPEIVNRWLDLVDSVFNIDSGASAAAAPAPANGAGDGEDNSKPCIAVHCVSGLGRAPVLVAIALIESGMDPLDAIEFIRKKRRGAINARQLRYLEGYTKQRGSKNQSSCCSVQ